MTINHAAYGNRSATVCLLSAGKQGKLLRAERKPLGDLPQMINRSAEVRPLDFGAKINMHTTSESLGRLVTIDSQIVCTLAH